MRRSRQRTRSGEGMTRLARHCGLALLPTMLSCSSSSPLGGSVMGYPLSTAQTGAQIGEHNLQLYFSSADPACQPPRFAVTYPFASRANVSFLEVFVVSPTGPVGPGDYPIPAYRASNALFVVLDAHCSAIVYAEADGGEKYTSPGNVHISSVGPNGVSGSMSLKFAHGGVIQGEFEVPICGPGASDPMYADPGCAPVP